LKIPGLVALEALVRSAKDNWFYARLARSRRIQRHVALGFDLAIRKLDDHSIAFDPNDRVMGSEIIATGSWFRHDFDRLIATLAENGASTHGKAFIDVGSNIGTQTLYALVSGHFSRAVAIEPEPSNIRCIRLNVFLNDLEARVSVVPVAAGAVSGRGTLTLDGDNQGGHSFVMKREPSPGKLDVEVTTIDHIIQSLGIEPSAVGLLWIDVEGYEPEAIAGARTLVSAGVPVAVEFNPKVYGHEVAKSFLAELSSKYRRFAEVIENQPIVVRSTAEAMRMEPRKADLVFF